MSRVTTPTPCALPVHASRQTSLCHAQLTRLHHGLVEVVRRQPFHARILSPVRCAEPKAPLSHSIRQERASRRPLHLRCRRCCCGYSCGCGCGCLRHGLCLGRPRSSSGTVAMSRESVLLCLQPPLRSIAKLSAAVVAAHPVIDIVLVDLTCLQAGLPLMPLMPLMPKRARTTAACWLVASAGYHKRRSPVDSHGRASIA